jgi:hypothetical protein
MFESPETDLHIAGNSCCIDCTDTCSEIRVYWLSNSPCPNYCTSEYGCDDLLEFNTGVTQVGLPIMGIHLWVASKSKIHWIPATVHNSRWMDDHEVCHGSIEDTPILDSVDVEEAYSDIASRHQSIQWHVRSHGWRDESFVQPEDSVERRLVFRFEVSSTEAFQILHWSHSHNGHASHFITQPWSFLEVAIV